MLLHPWLPSASCSLIQSRNKKPFLSWLMAGRSEKQANNLQTSCRLDDVKALQPATTAQSLVWGGAEYWFLTCAVTALQWALVGYLFIYPKFCVMSWFAPPPPEKGQTNASFPTWLCGSPRCSLNAKHQITSWTTAWSLRKGKVGGKWMALSNKTLRSNANRFSCINANVWRSPCHIISHCGG